MSKSIRTKSGVRIEDQATIDNMEYSAQAGGKKVLEVGRSLVPIPVADGGYTTDVSAAATPLPSQGRNLAIYNNSGSLASIAVGPDNTITALAPGVVDTEGNVGVPCIPNGWTYLACSTDSWVISSSSSLIVFLIDDNSYIRTEVAPYPGL